MSLTRHALIVASEGERYAADDAPTRLRLDAIQLIDDRNSHGDIARPLVVGEPDPGREIDNVASRILIRDAGGHLLVLPFTIDLEHKIDVGARCGGEFRVGMGRARCIKFWSTVIHRLWKISAEMHVFVFALPGGVAAEAIRERGVVEKPVTK